MPILEEYNFEFGNGYSISGSDVNVEKYEITIYEMGFSTKDPLSFLPDRDYSSEYDFSGNVKTFENENGLAVDLANGKSIDLSDGTNTRPPYGDYPYAYIIIDKTFKLRGSVQNPDTEGIYKRSTLYSFPGAERDEYSDSGGRSKQNPRAEDFTFDLWTFNFNGAEDLGSNYNIYNLDSGVLKNWLGGGPKAIEEGVKDKILISFKPNSPYKVTKSTKGINVTFDVTNSGMEVLLMDNGGGLNDRFVTEMDFAPIITLIE